MPISKKIKELKEPLEVDLQLMASELDTSVKNMKYLSKDLMTDATSIDAFDALVEDIERGEGIEITTFDDNTVLYEYLDEAIVIHNVLGVRYILFDSMITQKVENKLDSYR
jgi:hypothetical protein|nr:MAG TPA_asm: hypothetical protein [Caudoviricetes sp.]